MFRRSSHLAELSKSITAKTVVAGIVLLAGAAQAATLCNVYDSTARAPVPAVGGPPNPNTHPPRANNNGIGTGGLITNGSTAPVSGVCTFIRPYDPVVNDAKNGQSIADGSNITLKAGGRTINSGWDTRANIQIGVGVKNNVLKAVDASGAEVDISTRRQLLDGGQNSAVLVRDPRTGSNVTVNTFSSDAMSEFDPRNRQVSPVIFVGDEQYIDMRLATATNGGKVKVEIDDVSNQSTAGTSPDNPRTILLNAKQSHLFEANNGGSIEWNSSKLRLIFGQVDPEVPNTTSPLYELPAVKYAGTVNFNGTNYTVNNLAGLKAYNNALIAALRNGTLSANPGETLQQAYRRHFDRAYTKEPIKIYPRTAVGSSSFNEGNLPYAEQWVMYATGQNSKVVMKDGSALVTGRRDTEKLDMGNGHILGDLLGGAIMIKDQASGEIEKGARLSGFNNLVVLNNQSTLINNGVISAGFSALHPDTDTSSNEGGHHPVSGASQTGLDGRAFVSGYGVQVINKSEFTNNGIINVATSRRNEWDRQNYGVRLDGGHVTNNESGVINVAVNNDGIATQRLTNSTGVLISQTTNGNSSSVINKGEIYIGRTAQQSEGARTVATSEKLPTYGIWQKGEALIEHHGAITIGENIQNSTAIFIDEHSNANSKVQLMSGSHIHINGNIMGENRGLHAKKSGDTVIEANGTITLNGINGRGIKIEDNATVKLGDNSVINVNGGYDRVNRLRNYAIYAEGKDANNLAKADVKGDMNLKGEGAIGAYARGYAYITTTTPVHMEDGSHQIGYFIDGEHASIDVTPMTTNVATPYSVMFRIAEGATYNAKGMNIKTTGPNSKGIVVTGAHSGQKSTAITNNGGVYTLEGVGSSLITVEGNAYSQLDYKANVDIAGDGVTIGIVDGQGYGIDGKAYVTTTASGSAELVREDTQLLSSLSTQTNRSDVTAYITRTLGNLDFNGSYLNLHGANSTAFRMEDGGKLKVLQGASFNVNGDAIRSLQNNSYSGRNGGHTNNANLDRNQINAINVFNAQTGALTITAKGQSLMTGAAQTTNEANSRFTMSEESVWNITDDSRVTNLINRGTINFVGAIAELKNKAAYDTLAITENYLGVQGSTISVNSNWYQPNDLYTNTIVINGNAIGRTRVIATNGIGGNVQAPQATESGEGIEHLTDNLIRKYDKRSPVITVLGSDNFDNDTPTFVGEALINDSALVAQLTKIGKHYYWTLTTEAKKEVNQPPVQTEQKPTPIYVKATGTYLQTPFINREMGYDLLSKLHERVGEQQFDCQCVAPQTWGRLSYTDGYNQGKTRFAYAFKQGLVQFGHDLNVNVNEERRVHSGIMAGYSWSNNRFYDKYNSENGMLVENKETQSSKSNMASLGAYRTAYFANGSYVDLVANAVWAHNKYQTNNQLALSQSTVSHNGYGAGASVEIGRLYPVSERWYLQPQAQLSGQYIRFERIKDSVRTTEVKDSLSLQARIGARLTNGTFYLSSNLLHDIFAPKTRIQMGITALEERYNPTSVDVALGSDLPLDEKRKWQLYSDLKYSRALGKTHPIYTAKAPAETYSGRIGIRYSW